MIAFTICSNNYLAQASVLAKSFRQQNPGSVFYTIIVDEPNESIDYSKLEFKCILIKDIEPNIEALALKYDIIELNTCVKPGVFEYFFSNFDQECVIYFDPDIKIYAPLEQELNNFFAAHDILLTPHIFTEIPLDGKGPGENNFLNYGLYNLGFIGIKKTGESCKFLSWWKQRTYTHGYNRVEKGIFVDQLYINLAPLFYKNVFIISDKGYNMAPWNLHERTLTKKGTRYFVNEKEELKFFHFSSFYFNGNELPVHYYNRFTLHERKDLQEIYTGYNTDLVSAGYASFKKTECVYLQYYRQQVQSIAENNRQQFLKAMTFKQKMIFNLFKLFPARFITKIQRLVNNYIQYN